MDEAIINILKSDNDEDLAQLISNGLDMDYVFPVSHKQKHDMMKESPPIICVAALLGAIKCLKYLFINECDFYNMDKKRRSIIHFAACGGSLEIMNFLSELDLKFDWDAVDLYGNACVHYAIFYSHPDLVYWLWCQYGINLSTPNNRKMTPLHLAVVSENIDLIQFLCKNGSDVNSKNVLLYLMIFNIYNIVVFIIYNYYSITFGREDTKY